MKCRGMGKAMKPITFSKGGSEKMHATIKLNLNIKFLKRLVRRNWEYLKAGISDHGIRVKNRFIN